MSRNYFDINGNPMPEAARFFYRPKGSDFWEPTAEYEARWEAVAARVANFDGDLITESLVKGWSVEETIAQGLEDDAEHVEYARTFRDDFEFQLDHDMSMNG